MATLLCHPFLGDLRLLPHVACLCFLLVARVLAGDPLTVKDFVKYREDNWRKGGSTNAVSVVAEVSYVGRGTIDPNHACDFFELADKSGKTVIAVFTNPKKKGVYGNDKHLPTLRNGGTWEIKGVPWGSPKMEKMTWLGYNGKPMPTGKPFAVDLEDVQEPKAKDVKK